MSFSGRTPESLIPRSDSRNPATTCKGITKSGRPCRRPIDAKASQDDGVLAVTSVISDSDEEEIGAAAYFCWQHKDQAERLAAQDDSHDTHLYPLKERNSIDTLVERLGVLEVDETSAEPRRKRRENRIGNQTSGTRPPRRINRPPTWDKVEGPLISIPSDVMAEEKRRRTRPPKPAPQKKKPSFWASLCCASAAQEDDYVEVIRHKRRASHVPAPEQYTAAMPMQQTPQQQQPRPVTSRPTPPRRSSGPTPQPPPTTSALPARKALAPKAARPLNKTNRRDSTTTQLMRYIPSTLSPQLTATLLAELSKPISPHDEEGYIYIFWLTPDAAGPAPSSTASSLLKPQGTRPDHVRRTSDVMRQYSVKTTPGGSARHRGTGKESETILLKIGRANNVHRRMHEWTRQCGYALSLVRYYPYVPSSATPSPTPSPHASPASSRQPSAQNTVRKVPHAHRVERLVHLELGARRVVRKCEACGKEHREWFEVEASREGVRRVDEVVRRWVEWAESEGGE